MQSPGWRLGVLSISTLGIAILITYLTYNNLRREETLSKELKAAKTATRNKGALFAELCHEIRSPMSAIMGFSEHMLHEELDKSERSQCLHALMNHSRYLLNLLDDLLDLSKLETSHLQIVSIPCKLSSLIAGVRALAASQAELRGLEFHVIYEGQLPDTIVTDPLRLRQILVNLIQNAIKCTYRGSVKLKVRCLGDQGNQRLEFDVVDTGRGIQQEEKKQLFQPYFQGETQGGVGLGLAICKNYAQIIGGDVSLIYSEPDKGTTMRLTISFENLDKVGHFDPHKEPPINTGYQQTTELSLKGKRLLLAEDGLANQRALTLSLKKTGAQFIWVENGEEAIHAFKQSLEKNEAFDLIVMDMQMPVMNGYQATTELRKLGYTGPLIAFTANTRESDRERCIAAGCDDYLAKPIDRKHMLEVFSSWVYR